MHKEYIFSSGTVMVANNDFNDEENKSIVSDLTKEATEFFILHYRMQENPIIVKSFDTYKVDNSLYLVDKDGRFFGYADEYELVDFDDIRNGHFPSNS